MQSSAGVSHCLQKITRGPRPELADEHAQVARASHGDPKAIELLVSSNLGYVLHIAKEFHGRGIPFEDVVAEGCVGLLKAIRRYRPAKGTRFMTYASFWVRKEILAAVSDQPHAIHVPRYARQRGYGTPRILHLDLPKQADDALSIGDRLRHPDRLQNEMVIETEQTLQMRRHVMRLASREQAVIAMRYGLGGQPPQTLHEIGVRLGLSKERVRQILATALAHLREEIGGRARRRDRHPAC